MTEPYHSSPDELVFAPKGGWTSWMNRDTGRAVTFSWHAVAGEELCLRSWNESLNGFYYDGKNFEDSEEARKQCWEWMEGGPLPTTERSK